MRNALDAKRFAPSFVAMLQRTQPLEGLVLDQIAGDVAPTEGGSGGGLGASELLEIERFATNPGNLRMWAAAPAAAESRRPLVLVLHGCGQTASGYDAASGWSRLAAKHGFVVVYPEQRRANNDQTCFSWFRPTDIARIGGEAESIRQMVAKATTDFGIDVRRVYVCGLSAGGAMAAAMLATYPETFAGGAIIAGLPYGSAVSAGEGGLGLGSARARRFGRLRRQLADRGDLAGYRRSRRQADQRRRTRQAMDGRAWGRSSVAGGGPRRPRDATRVA